MVVRLAESLQLPLRERNELLLAAGFAPVYASTALDDPVLQPVRLALEHILFWHLPYPAVVVDRFGTQVAANAAFDVLTEGVDEVLIRYVPDVMAPARASPITIEAPPASGASSHNSGSSSTAGSTCTRSPGR